MSVDIKNKSLVSLKRAVEGIDMEKAIQYCADSEEFYIECLQDYCSNGRKEAIEHSYATEDWKKYAIEVHTLKSTSRTLGFEELGDIAEKMQAAAENGDVLYIKENNDMMLKKFEYILNAITSSF